MTDKKRYGELEESPENIPTHILATRLKLLLESEIISKELYQERLPPRYEHKLSNRGYELIPILEMLKEWG